MYRLILIFTILISLKSYSQTAPAQVQGLKYYEFKNAVRADSAFFLPRKDTSTTDTTLIAPGMIVYRPADSLVYYRKGNRMVPFASISDLPANLLDSARRSNDTLYFRTTLGGEIAVKLEGIKIPGVVGLQDSLAQRLTVPRTAFVFDSTSKFPRNDASSIVRMDNGRLLTVWTAFEEGTLDHDTAHIYGAESTDNGVTWHNYREIVHNFDSLGIFTPSLYRRDDGSVILIVRGMNSDTTSRFFQMESTDDGVSWSSPVELYSNPGKYLVTSADRIFRTSSGRLLFPFGLNQRGGLNSTTGVFEGKILFSEDDGETWDAKLYTIQSPDSLLSESGLFEIAGQLTLYWRSRSGVVYAANSTDDGDSWGAVYTLGLGAPNSTTTIVYSANNSLLIAAHNRLNSINGPVSRMSMDVSKSSDRGKTWSRVWEIESNADSVFFEPTIFQLDTGIIVNYSAGPSTFDPIASLKTIRVPYNTILFNSETKGNWAVQNQDSVAQDAKMRISGTLSSGVHNITASTAAPQFRIIRSEQTNQGLAITAGSGSTTFHSYEGTNTIYGRFIFRSSKGTDTIERARIHDNGFLGIGTASPTSTLHVNGSQAGSQVATTGNLTASSQLFIRITNASHLVTLPAASACNGRFYWLVNYVNSAVTIPSVNRDGAATTTLPAYAKWGIYSDGIGWYVFQD